MVPETARMRRTSGRIAAVEKAEVIGSGLAIDIPFPANRSFRERGGAVPIPAAPEFPSVAASPASPPHRGFSGESRTP
jgi:hypothetical protein